MKKLGKEQRKMLGIPNINMINMVWEEKMMTEGENKSRKEV